MLPPKERRHEFRVHQQKSHDTDDTISEGEVTAQHYLQKWPHCSYFGIFDGNSDQSTAEFLRDNLHNMIIKDKAFPNDPKKAISNAVAQADRFLLSRAYDKKTQVLHD